MKNTTLLATLLALPLCAAHAEPPAAPAAEPLAIARQGVFSSGGRVTDPVPGDYDPTVNWLDPERRGTTAHVDHANTFFQIPADAAGAPVVFLHGYGQTRTGWQSTPDGRPGWADFFLRAGHPVFLVDQPRRGAAGATERIVTDPGDVADGRFKAGEQAWYTHFRIGRVAPDRYEGSQFPEGPEALEQFFCQMTPNTGNYDEALFGTALGAVLADARRMTGRKAVYVTHSQGGRVGWATPAEDVAAIVAVEPGFAPEPGSDRYRKFLDAKVPMLFLFGDNIENGPADIESTAFWKRVLDQCRDFAAHYNADGGDAEVVHLPDLGIRGNSHFLFQERNSDALAALVEDWLSERGLANPAPQPRKEQSAMTDTALSPLDTALARIGGGGAGGVLLSVIDATSSAQDTPQREAKAKQFSPMEYDGLPYQQLANNTAGVEKPALVVFLHGGHARGEDNLAQIRLPAVAAIKDYILKSNIPAYFLVPQCPADHEWVPNRRSPGCKEKVVGLIRKYAAEKDIDTNRIYLCSVSMGSWGSWVVVKENPKLFAAAFIASGMAKDVSPEHFADTPLFVTVGSRERTADDLKRFVAEIKKSGGTVEFDTLDGCDHPRACSEAFTAKRLEWLFSQRRADPAIHDTGNMEAAFLPFGEASNSARIARFPVTNADYAKFVKKTGHQPPRYWQDGAFPAGKDKHPVLWVSLRDAEAYCAWLGAKDPAHSYRLPTAAEWETAAGPTPRDAEFNSNAVIARRLLAENPGRLIEYVHPKSVRKGEKDKLSDVISLTPGGGVRGWVDHANFTGFIYTDLFKEISDAGGGTTPVDAYTQTKTACGALDMWGNCWEWTSTKVVAENGAERGQKVNAIKGGSWYANRRSCLTDFQGEGRRPDGHYNTVGFRVVQTPKLAAPPAATPAPAAEAPAPPATRQPQTRALTTH